MTNSVYMKHPDGDKVVKPAANREYYEAKGFKYLGEAPDPGTEEAEETGPTMTVEESRAASPSKPKG